MVAKAEWAEIARIQACVDILRDPDRSAGERVDACIEYFAALDRWGLWPDDSGNPCIPTDVEIAARIAPYSLRQGSTEIVEGIGEMQTTKMGRPRLGERLTTRLAEPDFARVQEMAANEGTSTAAVLRRLIRAGLAEESQRRKGKVA